MTGKEIRKVNEIFSLITTINLDKKAPVALASSRYARISTGENTIRRLCLELGLDSELLLRE